MITIEVSEAFFPEKKYILDIIFNEFLSLKYRILISSTDDYKITLDNGKQLVIRDHFFSEFDCYNSYLNMNKFPEQVTFMSNEFITQSDIPIIFGNMQFEIMEEKIVCGVDFFASCFFMLTRLEERINNFRDETNRFPHTASLAYKNNFLNRPVVNEYVEMLWQMLCYQGIKQERKPSQFEVTFTHDIDFLFLWNDLPSLLRKVCGDVVNRKQYNRLWERISNFYMVSRGMIRDPYDTFDWLMDISESVNAKSHFYFMSKGLNYSIECRKTCEVIKRIKRRGHILGFHAGYDTFNSPDAWLEEKKMVDRAIGYESQEGRQHYLRFEAPITWQIWNKAGMKFDSTCGYEEVGYRCGTGNEYSVYDLQHRRKMDLKEKPLILMDVHATIDRDPYSEFEYNRYLAIVNAAKKNNYPITVLFHNSTFESNPRFIKFYLELIECVA